MEAGTASGGASGLRALRPLDVGETLDAAVNLYSRNAVKLWTLVATVMVPVYALIVIIRRLTLPSGVFVHNGSLYTFGNTSSSAYNVGLVATGVLALLGYLLATGAVFKFQLDAYLGRPADVRESFTYAFGRHRLLSLLWLGIIVTIAVGIGFVLLIIPGVYLFVALAFAIPVLMLEGLRGMSAISRSISLTTGRWWATFGRLLIGLILYVVAVFLVGVIGSAITHGVSSVSLYLIINGCVGIIISVFLAPFYAALVNVTYVDLRVRKEGIGHDALLSGATPTGTPPGVEPLPGTAPAPESTPTAESAPTQHAGPEDFSPPGEQSPLGEQSPPSAPPPSSGPPQTPGS
jgi:hypothetical protein